MTAVAATVRQRTRDAQTPWYESSLGRRLVLASTAAAAIATALASSGDGCTRLLEHPVAAEDLAAAWDAPCPAGSTGAALPVAVAAGSVTITEEALPALKLVAGGMRPRSEVRIASEGHTDRQGADGGDGLSRERATAIRDYLVARYVLDAGRFAIAGPRDRRSRQIVFRLVRDEGWHCRRLGENALLSSPKGAGKKASTKER